MPFSRAYLEAGRLGKPDSKDGGSKGERDRRKEEPVVLCKTRSVYGGKFVCPRPPLPPCRKLARPDITFGKTAIESTSLGRI